MSHPRNVQRAPQEGTGVGPGPLHSGTLRPDGAILLAPEPGLGLQGAEQALEQPWRCLVEVSGSLPEEEFAILPVWRLFFPRQLPPPSQPTPSSSSSGSPPPFFIAVETRGAQITQFN